MDKLNADGNLIGRLGALIVLGASIFVVGRVTGMSSMCPLGGEMKGCCLFQTAPKSEAPAQNAAPAAPAPKK